MLRLARPFSPDLKNHQVLKLMKEDCNLSYQKVRPYIVNPNAEDYKMKRQAFATELVDQLAAGRRILNLDETNLSYQSFWRKAWGVKGRGVLGV